MLIEILQLSSLQIKRNIILMQLNETALTNSMVQNVLCKENCSLPKIEVNIKLLNGGKIKMSKGSHLKKRITSTEPLYKKTANITF